MTIPLSDQVELAFCKFVMKAKSFFSPPTLHKLIGATPASVAEGPLLSRGLELRLTKLEEQFKKQTLSRGLELRLTELEEYLKKQQEDNLRFAVVLWPASLRGKNGSNNPISTVLLAKPKPTVPGVFFQKPTNKRLVSAIKVSNGKKPCHNEDGEDGSHASDDFDFRNLLEKYGFDNDKDAAIPLPHELPNAPAAAFTEATPVPPVPRARVGSKSIQKETRDTWSIKEVEAIRKGAKWFSKDHLKWSAL